MVKSILDNEKNFTPYEEQMLEGHVASEKLQNKNSQNVRLIL